MLRLFALRVQRIAEFGDASPARTFLLVFVVPWTRDDVGEDNTGCATCLLEIQPLKRLKNQGRRFPAASITQAFSIRRLCASGCLAEFIQLIKSLRSIGVRSLH